MFCAACGWVCTYKNLRVILLFACVSPLLWVYTVKNAYRDEFVNEVDMRIYVKRWRSNGLVFWKSVSAGTFPEMAKVEGTYSESGKKHGEWTTTVYSPFKQTEEYFWYGEQITEGEWHLRNKQ